jgi:sugar-phosphatase
MNAAIFDMDGLLIDSEPLWQEAEITVFRSVGVMLTRELCRETMGLRLDEVVSYWYGRFPWRGASLKAVEEKILAVVGRLVIERGKPMPGVREVVDVLRAANYELAVASSSPMSLIEASLKKFGFTEYFSVLHSADAEEEGKPHPGVYISTISRLGASPGDCVAFEDSVVGVHAAKAAGTRVIAVPDAANARDPGFAKADVVLSSLTDFSLDLVR